MCPCYHIELMEIKLFKKSLSWIIMNDTQTCTFGKVTKKIKHDHFTLRKERS